MSSYLDSIPQAVATIVSACVANMGTTRTKEDLDAAEARVVDLTAKLTSTFTKALRDAEAEK